MRAVQICAVLLPASAQLINGNKDPDVSACILPHQIHCLFPVAQEDYADEPMPENEAAPATPQAAGDDDKDDE